MTHFPPLPNQDSEIVLRFVENDLVHTLVVLVQSCPNALSIDLELQDEAIPILVQKLVQDCNFQMGAVTVEASVQGCI